MTTDAFRLGQKGDRSVLGYEMMTLKERRVEGYEGTRCKVLWAFHERRMLSIKWSGNTHCHVTASTSDGTSQGSDQLSRHPEIAKFDNPFTGQENVRRLYIPVNNLFKVQVCQSL